MHGVAELLCGRTRRRGRAAHGYFLLVAGRLAIRAPVSLVSSRVCIEDDDAAVLIPVGDEDLVRLRIDFHPRQLPEPRDVAAARLRTGFSDL